MCNRPFSTILPRGAILRVMSASNKPVGETPNIMTAFMAYSFCAIVMSPIFLFIYRRDLDNAGWIPHRHTVDVYIQGDWFDGENRVCSGIQTNPGDKKLKEISALHCPPDSYEPDGGKPAPSADISTHNLTVIFRGRVSRPAVRSIDEASGARFEWNCTRKSDGLFGDEFVCHSIN